MAIHSRKDFASLCGLKPRELSVYISRGKVLMGPGNKVDDGIPENAEFLNKRLGKDGSMKIEVKKKEFTQDDEEKLQRIEEYSKLNTQKRKLENAQLDEGIQLLRIKKEKMEGFLIPTPLVKMLFEQHFRSITISFQQGAENLIVEISKKKKLTRDESAGLRKKLVDLINKSVNEAVEHSKKGVEDMIRLASQKTGPGRR